MTFSKEVLDVLLKVFVVILSVTLPLFVWLFKRAVVKSLDDLKDVVKELEKKFEKRMDMLEGKFGEFKEEVIRDYARKSDLNDNNQSHKELWNEINDIRERVAKMEK